MGKLKIRIPLFIVVAILIVMLPWWLTLALIVFLTVIIPFYFEVLFYGFIIDVVYGVNLSFPLIGLTSGAVFLLIVSFVRSQIRT
jgi:hypothetical protein